MKILNVENVINNASKAYQRKQNPVNKIQSQNNYFNNSLSETMGRVQLNFKGQFYSNPSSFEYNSSSGRKDETIKYDKETQTFRYCVSTPELATTVTYNPQTKEEITEEKRPSINPKRTRVIINSPVEKRTTITNQDGTILFSYYYDKISGNSTEYRNEISKGREITISIRDDIRTATVLDKKTGEYVTEGELTWVNEEDKENNLKITRNIVTGIVVRKESLEKTDIKEFWESTGELKSEYYYSPKNDLYVLNAYSKDGSLKHSTLKSASGRDTEEIDYSDGKETKHVIIINEGKNQTKTIVMVPNTNRKNFVITEYKDRVSGQLRYVKHIFRDLPNNYSASFVYDKSTNSLLEETEFYPDGKTPSRKISYLDDGTKTEFRYNKNGTRDEFYKFSSTDFLLSYIKYSDNKPSMEVEKDPNTNETVLYLFDLMGKYLTEHHVFDKNYKRTESATYHPKSDMVNVRCVYHRGYCEETQTDKRGNVIKSTNRAYREDIGEVRKMRAMFEKFETLNKYSQSDVETVVQNVASTLRNNKDLFDAISMEEWKLVAHAMGLKNISELYTLDEKYYQNIAMKLSLNNRQNPQGQYYTNLIEILKFFYDKNV